MDIWAIIVSVGVIVGIIAGVAQVLEYIEKRREKRGGLNRQTQLCQILTERLGEGDLRALCLELGIDYDDLRGRGKASKVRKLVADLERRGRIPELVGIGKQLHPDVSWGDTPKATGDAPSDLQSAPPEPLRAATPTAPAPPRHFIGRAHHLAALEAALTGGSATPLIALQGMGGIGKTATALKLAAQLSSRFPGGVFWGSLPTYDGNPRPILRNWAQICGQALPDEADPSAMADRARDLLVRRQTDSGPLLAIVDDVRLEWLDATQVLKQAIPAGVSLLLTTRDVSLAATLGADKHYLDALPANKSLDLLKAHAGAAVVEADQAEAEGLLQAVGYLPLAIELAGKRLAMLARKPGYRLATLRQAIEEQAAQVLTLPGHPGLAATFAVTYEILPSEAQRLFRWLGAFASSPLKVNAVAGVISLDEMETESALDELVLLSSLNWGETAGTYALHPLLRQYAQTLLAEAGEADEAEQEHLAYYLALAQANAQAEPSAWDELEAELPNLLLAAKRAAQASDSVAMVAFEEALLHDSLFLNVRGYYREAIDLFSQSLEVQESLGEQQHRARTLNKMAFFYTRLGRQYEEAEKHADKAYSLALALNDREQQADSLHYLGIIFEGRGKNRAALECFEKELGIRRELGNLSRLANCLNSLEAIHELLGNYAEAEQYINEALLIYRELNDPYGLAMCTGNRGIPLLYMGDYLNAMKDFKAALDLSIELDDREGIAQSLFNIGLVQSYFGNYSLSLESLQASLSRCEKMGHKPGETRNLSALAEVYSALGDCNRAVECLQTAGEQLREIDDKSVRVRYLNALGAVHYDSGDYDSALRDYQALADEAESGYFLAQGKLGLARAYIARDEEGDWEDGRRYAAESINLCQELRLAGSLPSGHAYLGKASLLLGSQEMALESCREAMHLLEDQKHLHGSEAEIYLITVQVLAANGLEDERSQYLEQAYRWLHTAAAKIEDETLRQSYLAMPLNREIVETWARERAEKTA